MSNKVSYLFIMQDKFSRLADRISRKTTNMQNKFSRLNGVLQRSASSFKSHSKTFVGGFKNMFAAAAAFFGIKGFLTIGARFQDSLADLSAITGATGKDLEILQDNIFRLGKDSATSADEVAEAFKLVASAKPELLENLDALTATTEQVLLLKNAAGIQLADAANIAAQGLNIFGAGADQASRFVNVLAAGAKLGASEISDTGAAMLIAGPAARAAGLSFEQLNAAIQTVAKGGIKAERSGTALNAIFGRLQRQGIDFQKLGLQGSFELIKRKMDSLESSTARAQFASQVFGEEHSKVGFALMANVELLGKYEKSLAGTNIAEEQAALRLSTFNAKARRLGTILTQSMIKTFLRLEPTLTKIVEDMSRFFENIKPEEVEAFADSLRGLIEVGRVLGTALGYIFDVIKAIGEAIGQLTAAIATLDFSQLTGSAKDIFDIGSTGPLAFVMNKLFNDEMAPLNGSQTSRTDVNVNLRAPQGAVESVKSKTTGKVSGLNVGVNMAEAL